MFVEVKLQYGYAAKSVSESFNIVSNQNWQLHETYIQLEMGSNQRCNHFKILLKPS